MAFTYRNPFLSRFSDRTGLSNETFLATYAPQVLGQMFKKFEHLLLPKATWLISS